MPRLETIITGCAFHDPQSGRWVWGDLWQLGDTYIFNAVLEKGEAAWVFGEPDPARKAISRNDGPYHSSMFDRRGVLVIHKSDTTLNQAAREYLHATPT